MKTIEIYHDLLKLSNIANTFVESMAFDVIIYRNFSQKADSSPVSRTRNMSNKDTLLLEAQPLLSRGLCFFVGRLKTFFAHSQCCLLYVLFSMFDTFFIMCHFARFDRLFYTIDTFF